MKHKLATISFAIMLVGLLALSNVYAYGGKMAKFGNEDARFALEDGDFIAFKEALSQSERGEKFANRITEERFQKMSERMQKRALIHDALENEDYQAWKSAVSDVRHNMAQKITEENFSTLVALHEARMNGDHETAQELANELGLEKHKRHKRFGKYSGQNKGLQWSQ